MSSIPSKTNCGPTTHRLERIDQGLGDRRWDVVHWTFGLHELKHMGPNRENVADPTAETSRLQVATEAYEANIKSLVERIKQAGTVVIWWQMSPVPGGADGRLPGDAKRYNAAAAKVIAEVGDIWPGRSRKSTRPGATGVVELSLLEFLDRLADLVPPPRKHRHRYHGVFAPNHKLRPAVTALAIGNIGKRREAVTGGHGGDGHATEGCCDANQKPRSHDTSRIAWAKLMARVGEEFPLECPNCGGDIRLREDGRQEPAHFEPEVRKREKARMASPA